MIKGGLGVTKEELRKEIKTALREQTLSDRDCRSAAIGGKLFSRAEMKKAKAVLFYASMPVEVNTWPMMEKALMLGKKVLLPRIDLQQRQLKVYEIKDLNSDTERGVLGICQPRTEKTKEYPIEMIDTVIVPGLLFDRENRRLGRGAGFYDRFLVKLKKDIPKIGLAFSFQVVDRLAVDDHDVALDAVLTD